MNYQEVKSYSMSNVFPNNNGGWASMRADPALNLINRWLKKQEQILAVPAAGDQIVRISGRDIIGVSRRNDEMIVATTIEGSFHLLSEEHVSAMVMPQEFEPAAMQRISDKLHINLRRVQGIDYEGRIVTIEGRAHWVQEKYWEEFVKAHESQ
ncbi:hypothetical protein [Paenibacillus sp. NPDC057934]|uniref:hypothetical protein n=1 Tax=Paenibacillus sp. NPDC057934 TaxID=3346282 RepID=UPI0036D9448E